MVQFRINSSPGCCIFFSPAQSPANNLTVLRGYQMHTNWHQGEILCVQGAGADTGKPPCALWHITEPCRASLGKAALCGTVPASLFLTPLLRDQVFSMGTVPPLHTKGFCIQCHTMGRRRETANSTCLDHFAKYLDLLYWDLPFLFSVSTENLLLLPWWQSAAGCWKRFWIIKFGGSGGWRTVWPRSVCHLKRLAELFNRRDFFAALLVLVGHKPKSKKWDKWILMKSVINYS